jgi:5-formyltetrahydrofolate cyclo-ligase
MGFASCKRFFEADRKNVTSAPPRNSTEQPSRRQVMPNRISMPDKSCVPCYHFCGRIVVISIEQPQQKIMSDVPVSEVQERKAAIRKQAHENRRHQTDKDSVSNAIMRRFLELPEYAAAKTVMFYVDVRDEVRTRQALPEALTTGKRIVVPYCVEGELELFWLESMDELELGMYRILEPKTELRTVAAKHLQPKDLDLIMVPGVAFDREGGRTGHGKGYYDKLLEHASENTPLVALAFDCQMFDAIPMDQHDIYMDKVITESAVYEGRGRI